MAGKRKMLSCLVGRTEGCSEKMKLLIILTLTACTPVNTGLHEFNSGCACTYPATGMTGDEAMRACYPSGIYCGSGEMPK